MLDFFLNLEYPLGSIIMLNTLDLSFYTCHISGYTYTCRIRHKMEVAADRFKFKKKLS